MNSTQSSGFVETLEHRRFAEFCDACARYRYIGLCYGRPGVGKTLSARRCSRWDYFDDVNPYTIPDETLAAFIGVRTIFYTTPVVNTPRQIDRDIARLRSQLQFLAKEPLRREAAQKLKQINIRDNRHAEEMFTTHDWLSEPMPKLKPTYAAISRKYAAKEKCIGDPTQLILVDEADRLKMASLEQIRAIFDAGEIGLVLIGMPGLEKRLARYAQFYSRIGFVHEFRPLSADQVRELLARRWRPWGVALADTAELDAETVASIIRVTGGDFRLPVW